MTPSQIPLWVVILTSAAVGALVSAGLTLFAQRLERQARRRELLLSKSMELAYRYQDMRLQHFKDTGKNQLIPDAIVMADSYYGQLVSMFDHGHLPEDYVAVTFPRFKAEVDEFIEEIRQEELAEAEAKKAPET